MRPRGNITRGTTFPNRLRRLDRWLAPRVTGLLRPGTAPVVVDLGYGAHPVTTVEWFRRLSVGRPDLRMVGLEIDPERVAAAAAATVPGRLEFRLGGFELAGLRPRLVRAMNVLRQYPEPEAARAWHELAAGLAPGGRFVDGTCDEIGRVASWVLHDEARPLTLTLAADLASLESPAVLAERLPKALIHRNVPGEPVHALLAAAESAWRQAAGWQVFGPRDRWRRTLVTLQEAGWPVAEPPSRRRDGTLTVPWESVAPG
ncbi:hypothetical protein LX16_2296 [Stackebrandtia albiflava]|uniref:Uncharacterized protein n=1 Tax=Stackebrandtia albiflava TaxID=406432 RepID=A0A562V143_9ACTN|nr:class I SAM-dependent methyltransferase [Stackebrandtia albiflava]TWJ11571.1 hypothetical protein LX16_2296 [Stackebrandtia albiflava]